MKIIKLEGLQMEQLVDALESTKLVHTLRVSVGSDGAKFKINGGVWSPPLGEVEVDG